MKILSMRKWAAVSLAILAAVMANTVVAQATKPGAPVITSQRMASDGSMAADIAWTAPANGGSPLTQYVVQVLVAGAEVGYKVVPGTYTSARLPLSPRCGTPMWAQVAAYNAIGATGSTSIGTFQFPCPAPTATVAPPPPGALVAPIVTQGALTPSSVALSWAAVPGAQKYTVQRSYNGYFYPAQTSTYDIGTATTYSGLLSQGQTWYFRVRAEIVTPAPVQGPWSAFTGATAPAPPTPSPTPALVAPTVTVTAADISSATLSWNAIPGATAYIAQDSLDSTFATGTRSNQATATTIKIPFQSYGKTEYYRVKAVNAAGVSGPYSATVSKVIPSGVTNPSIPAPVNATVTPLVGTGAVKLYWNAVAGATSYLVSRCGDAPCTYIAAQATVTTAFYQSVGVAKGTTLSHRVQACTTQACGNYTPVLSAVAQ